MISDIRHRSKTFSAGIALALAGLCLGSRIAHAQVSQPAPTRAGSNQGAVDARGLPPQFISVSNITAQIQVIPHCSRLLKLRGNIVRSFVADPKLIEAVQFGPNELGF